MRLKEAPFVLCPLISVAGHFLARYAKRAGKNIEGFSDEAMGLLLQHDWPGNVRELENGVERAVAMAEGPQIAAADVAAVVVRRRRAGDSSAALAIPRLPASGLSLELALEDTERKYIRSALDQTGGNLTRAAKLLGTTFRSLRYRVKKLGLEREGPEKG